MSSQSVPGKSPRQHAAAAVPVEPVARQGAPLVLIAEDHEDTRFLLKTLLTFRGLAVVEAANGMEAVETVRRERPDLVLMDGSLPLLDGFSATRMMRALDPLREVPIIFISGHADQDSQAAARDAGCDEYMIKPLDYALLDRMLERRLAHRLAGASGSAV
ncbi:MAG: response regulator [Pyrinomonadaceae bacterium]